MRHEGGVSTGVGLFRMYGIKHALCTWSLLPSAVNQSLRRPLLPLPPPCPAPPTCPSQEVEALGKRNTSEVIREAARLNESVVALRLERGKLAREEVLLREKVHYVERVNAELHELLERYEGEFFQHQLQLEGDKQAEASHARMLQVSGPGVGRACGGSKGYDVSWKVRTQTSSASPPYCPGRGGDHLPCAPPPPVSSLLRTRW